MTITGRQELRRIATSAKADVLQTFAAGIKSVIDFCDASPCGPSTRVYPEREAVVGLRSLADESEFRQRACDVARQTAADYEQAVAAMRQSLGDDASFYDIGIVAPNGEPIVCDSRIGPEAEGYVLTVFIIRQGELRVRHKGESVHAGGRMMFY